MLILGIEDTRDEACEISRLDDIREEKFQSGRDIVHGKTTVNDVTVFSASTECGNVLPHLPQRIQILSHVGIVRD